MNWATPLIKRTLAVQPHQWGRSTCLKKLVSFHGRVESLSKTNVVGWIKPKYCSRSQSLLSHLLQTLAVVPLSLSLSNFWHRSLLSLSLKLWRLSHLLVKSEALTRCWGKSPHIKCFHSNSFSPFRIWSKPSKPFAFYCSFFAILFKFFFVSRSDWIGGVVVCRRKGGEEKSRRGTKVQGNIWR